MKGKVTKVEAKEFLDLAKRYPVLDVRSPGEFSQGHIPGAVSLPVFDNPERAQVGTTYVQTGSQQAIALGESIAEGKTGYYWQQIAENAKEGIALLHCWRGGMRSGRMADFFAEKGYQIILLQGGYKAYRHFIRQAFTEARKYIVLGGYTGSGKTELLHELANRGKQTIDLEALAHHKGSLFGHLGETQQPTTEQFENELFRLWSQLDPSQPVFVERESLSIGKVYLPETFFRSVASGTVIKIQLSRAQRASRLVQEYGHFGQGPLMAAVQSVGKHMDPYLLHNTRKALLNNDLHSAAEHLLQYYDRSYDHQKKSQTARSILHFDRDPYRNEEFPDAFCAFLKENHLI